MKALSIKQPWGHLIALGLKDIENRTWKTTFRGKFYIHASGKLAKAQTGHDLLTGDQYEALKSIEGQLVKYLDSDYEKGAIIGEVELIDCVINHESIWAEKTDFSKEDPDTIWNWVLANAILYEKPILNVKGKLSFWEFRELIECRCCTDKETEAEMHICQRCEQEYCVSCQAPYNQYSQIDYPCCMDCYNRDDRD